VLLVAQNTRGRKNSPPAIRLYATWLQCLVEYIFQYVVCLSEKEMGPSFALRISSFVVVPEDYYFNIGPCNISSLYRDLDYISRLYRSNICRL